MLKILHLRREIGDWLKWQRLAKNLDIETAARRLEVEAQLLQEYESGATAIKGAEFFKMIMLYEIEAEKVILFLKDFRIKKELLYKKAQL